MSIKTDEMSSVLIYEHRIKCNIIEGVKALSFLKVNHETQLTEGDELSFINDFYLEGSDKSIMSLKDNNSLGTTELFEKNSPGKMIVRPTTDLFHDMFKLVIKLNINASTMKFYTNKLLVVDQDNKNQITIPDAEEYMKLDEVRDKILTSDKADRKYFIYYQIGESVSEIRYVKVYDSEIGVIIGTSSKSVDEEEMEKFISELLKVKGGEEVHA